MTVKRQKHIRKRNLFILFLIVILVAFLWHPIYNNVFLKSVYPQKYSDLVYKYARENDLEPCFVFSIIRNESSFNKDAVSSVGARGLMQITPDTFDWAMSKLSEDGKYTEDDLFDPEINIRYGTFLISTYLNEFEDPKTAIAAYHAGRGNIKKWLTNPEYSEDGKIVSTIPFKGTDTYVARVLEAKEIYKKLYGD